MFICPICKKEFETLDEFSKHIGAENETDKKDKEKAKTELILAKEKKIRETYDFLKKLVDEYNKMSEDKTCVTSLSFRQNSQISIKSDFPTPWYLNDGNGWLDSFDKLFRG